MGQADFLRFVGIPIAPMYPEGDVTAALEQWATSAADLEYRLSRIDFVLLTGIAAEAPYFLVPKQNSGLVRLASRSWEDTPSGPLDNPAWEFWSDPFVNVDQRMEAHLRDATVLCRLRLALHQDKCIASLRSPVLAMGWMDPVPNITVGIKPTSTAKGPWPTDAAWHAAYIEPWCEPLLAPPTIVLPLPVGDEPDTPYTVNGVAQTEPPRLYYPRRR